MKRYFFVIVIAFIGGCSGGNGPKAKDESKHGPGHHGDHAGASSSAILMIQSAPQSPKPGAPTELTLMIHNADGSMVHEFDVIHDKLAHLIMVRDGLDEFAHVHPEVDRQGNLRTTHTFAKAGKYRLFVDYKSKGQAAATAMAELDVAGDAASAPPLVVNAPGKVSGDGVVAEIEVRNARAAQEADIQFRLLEPSGAAVSTLQPYLGARGHVVILSANGTQYVHAHPGENSADGSVVLFKARFPSSGLYKGWGQFLVADLVRTIPFVVQIP
jgi:hypothetical protein